MSTVEVVFRELLAGIQSSRIYFAGHARVSASASDILDAVRAHDAESGFVMGVDHGVPIVDQTPLPKAVDQIRPLLDSLSAWGSGGLYIRPDATEKDLTDLLGALAHPPPDEPNLPLFRGTSVGLLPESAVHDEDEDDDRPVLDLRWERARQSRESTVCLLERGVEDLREDLGLDVDEVGGAAHDLLNLVCTTPELALSQISMRGHDRYTFVHTVNVSVYTLAVARRYVRRAETMISLAQAALLHDVGKVAVPREVLYKQGSYTAEEWELMRAHPVRGAEILATTPGVDDLAVMAAFGHHLRYDGSGYPKVGAQMLRHPLVDLLAIADVYEALVAERPYKKRLPPDEAMSIIVRGAGRQFDARMVGAFVRAIGIFPAGTCVKLSDGREGIVSGTNPEDVARPPVRIPGGATAEIVDLADAELRRQGLRIVGTLSRAPRMAELAGAEAGVTTIV
jgi:HD-GYP domain-containing protein (c-di-GMP phosphodiesterase class II)